MEGGCAKIKDKHTSSVRTTPQRTRFRDEQHARIMGTVWVDDDKTKLDFTMKKKNLELRWRGETERYDVRHQWQRENQDQHQAHETRHLTSECARCLLVSSCFVFVVILTHYSTHRVAQVVRVFVSCHPCMKWSSLFDFELSIPSNLLSVFSINLKQFLLPFHFHEDK